MHTEERYNRKLLVEGNDDMHVILALCAQHTVLKNFDIIDSNGVDFLLKQLPQRLKESDIETIGIIVDADTDLSRRWQRISAILSDAGFVVPGDINDKGLLLSHPVSNIKFGAWIMPDNNINGMLEDFLRFLIPADDNLLPIADNTLSDIEKNNLNRYSPIHKSKALIHTWLAWQEESGKPLGQSITMRYLQTDHATCSKLVNWLKTTFAD